MRPRPHVLTVLALAAGGAALAAARPPQGRESGAAPPRGAAAGGGPSAPRPTAAAGARRARAGGATADPATADPATADPATADTATADTATADSAADWPVTGGGPANDHYSPLAQIDRGNVARLAVAWSYRTGDLPAGGPGEMQATPVVVDGVLYTTTPALAVVALRAATGEPLWRFDPFAGRTPEVHANRGVAYWTDGVARRVLVTAGRRLYALDARTGRPAAGFGDSGWVALAAGLGRELPAGAARSVWDIPVVATSPGVVVGDLLVQGSRVSEGEGARPGHVRAFDVRTGRVRWTFHTIPQPGEPGTRRGRPTRGAPPAARTRGRG
jgi:glucose dehydrogenase